MRDTRVRVFVNRTAHSQCGLILPPYHITLVPLLEEPSNSLALMYKKLISRYRRVCTMISTRMNIHIGHRKNVKVKVKLKVWTLAIAPLT